MLRREFHHHASAGALGTWLLALAGRAHALSLADLSAADASGGLKAALSQGAQAAVASLGQGRRIDELVTSINRAAEAAVPLARTCWCRGGGRPRRGGAALARGHWPSLHQFRATLPIVGMAV